MSPIDDSLARNEGYFPTKSLSCRSHQNFGNTPYNLDSGSHLSGCSLAAGPSRSKSQAVTPCVATGAERRGAESSGEEQRGAERSREEQRGAKLRPAVPVPLGRAPPLFSYSLVPVRTPSNAQKRSMARRAESPPRRLSCDNSISTNRREFEL